VRSSFVFRQSAARRRLHSNFELPGRGKDKARAKRWADGRESISRRRGTSDAFMSGLDENVSG
jgi:hypothetical protein